MPETYNVRMIKVLKPFSDNQKFASPPTPSPRPHTHSGLSAIATGLYTCLNHVIFKHLLL